jgi:nucleoside-diphosphate-sugar epimerase
MDVLITGAYGRVGTALIDYLNGYNLYYFDQEERPEYNTILGDVADFQSVTNAVSGSNAIVHLAAASRVDDSWAAVLEKNIIGSYNCFEAAKNNEIEQVVLASTNHVVGMYEQESAPELYDIEYELTLTKDSPVRPDSYYATSKVFSESLGRYYVENFEFPRQVYVLRIGSVRMPENDHPYADAERGVKNNQWKRHDEQYELEVKRMKSTWQSRMDLAHMVDLCLDDSEITFDIFYGTSNNPRGWLDIDHAKQRLGYRPVDSGEDWSKPPSAEK